MVIKDEQEKQMKWEGGQVEGGLLAATVNDSSHEKEDDMLPDLGYWLE